MKNPETLETLSIQDTGRKNKQTNSKKTNKNKHKSKTEKKRKTCNTQR